MQRYVGRPVALVGDIGGTRARFALCDPDGSNVRGFTSMMTRDYGTIREALATYLAGEGARPETVSLAVAGPVSGGRVDLTNADWHFTAGDVAQVTGAADVRFVNDFEALARVLPDLAPCDLAVIVEGGYEPGAPRIVLGPGTGFGVASLVTTRKGRVSVAGEGGHVTFGATSEEERRVRDLLAARHGHVSVERVLSGNGIEAIYTALGGSDGATVGDIVKHGLEGDPPARAALDMFTRVLARIAGDMALVLGARGGVYIAGGIAPRMLSALDTDMFREAFRAKGRLSAYLDGVPVRVITAEDAGLRGAAAMLADPPAALESDRQLAGWADH
jgi:glucokinase